MRITVEVSENPSTGYSWDYVPVGDMVELVDDLFLVGSHDPELIGGGGTRKLVFTVEKHSDIQLIKHRLWEKVEPIETLTIHID